MTASASEVYSHCPIYSNPSGLLLAIYCAVSGNPPATTLNQDGSSLLFTGDRAALERRPELGDLVIVDYDFDRLLPLVERYVAAAWDGPAGLATRPDMAGLGPRLAARRIAWAWEGCPHSVVLDAALARRILPAA